ncbi:hypothetical protein GQ457_01G008210 [Hibiscus cannabinus]
MGSWSINWLLLFLSLHFIVSVSGAFHPITHVVINNKIQAGKDLIVHCKSKDDDLGVFRFDIYDQERDNPRCGKHCEKSPSVAVGRCLFQHARTPEDSSRPPLSGYQCGFVFEKVAQTPRKWPKSLPMRPPSVVIGRCLFRHVRTPTKCSRRPLHFSRTGFPRRHSEFRENGLEIVVFNNVDLSSSPLDRRET